MEFFSKLGNNIHDSWKRRNFAESAFNEVATAELRALPPSEHVSSDEVVDWVHDTPILLPQFDIRAEFGQPPISVFRGSRFHIDVLFWTDSTTSIHQHGFSGALHVMEGSSIHSQYKFDRAHRYSERLMVGSLELLSVEHLRQGDVRAIRGGDAFIHALFHLERPSVSVVVRTGTDASVGPQYTYLRNGIAFDPFFRPEAVVRQTQTLEMYRTLGRSEYLDRARRTINASDAFGAFHLISKVAEWLPNDEEYHRFLDGLESQHPDLLERLRRQRSADRREYALTRRRQRIHAAEHRFFLALLLNVPSRLRILELVRKAYPDTPPEDTLFRWISEVAAERLPDGKSAIDIELDESGLRILRHMVDGASDGQVVDRLREEFDDEDVDSQRDDVLKLCAAFRQSIFHTLTVD